MGMLRMLIARSQCIHPSFRAISILALVLASCILNSCASQNGISSDPCPIVAPDRTLIKREVIARVQKELESFVNSGGGSNFEAVFKNNTDQTYQKIPDKDAACALMLSCYSCLSKQNRSKEQLDDFLVFLKETKGCATTNAAKISIDNIVQVKVDDNEAARSKFSPIAFDLFLRNSGDEPALVTSVTAWFDENLRPSRSPADMQQLTAVYTVAIDSTGAVVEGANLHSPAKAYYPSPGSSVLIVESPIAQTLGPRSTDRFRVKFDFLENAELRGPRDQVRVEVNFNKGEAVSSSTLKLAILNPWFMNSSRTNSRLINNEK
jgi:hypothetical protein